MIERIVDIGDPRQNGFRFSQVFSETNGVGSMPTQVLERQLAASGIPARVTPVATTARTKEDAFGTLKMLMQQGKLKLPSHPSLLRQLAALEFETTETGTVKISVPERSGHDDLAMALALAATGISKPSGAMQFLSSISWQCACGTLNCRSEDFCQRCARRRGAEPPDAGDDGLPRSWGRW
jgi:hypothetical protein